MSVPKRQHTIQKALLRGFASGGHVLMDRRGGDRDRVGVNVATVRQHFYSFRDGTQFRFDVEEWLGSQFEHPMGGLLGSLRAGHQPSSPDEVRVIRNYVAVTLLRTVPARKLMEQIDDRVKGLTALLSAAPEAGLDLQNLSPAELQEWIAFAAKTYDKASTQLLEVDETRKSFLRSIVRETRVLTARLKPYVWSVRKPKGRAQPLVLSDAAVVVPQPSRGFHGVVPPGQPVYLPLAPDALLVGDPRERKCVLSPHLAAKVNILSARRAHDALIAHPDLEWPPNLGLSNERPSLPNPRTVITRCGPGDITAEKAPQDNPDLLALFADLGLERRSRHS